MKIVLTDVEMWFILCGKSNCCTWRSRNENELSDTLIMTCQAYKQVNKLIAEAEMTYYRQIDNGQAGIR